MGVDVYLYWDGEECYWTLSERLGEHSFEQWVKFSERHIKSFYPQLKDSSEIYRGQYGYLRGAYFGGYSDVLSYMFNWMDWKTITPFNFDAYRKNLDKIKEEPRRKATETDNPMITNLDRLSPNSLFQELFKSFISEALDLENVEFVSFPGYSMKIDEEYIGELADFYILAQNLENDGKHPRVYISY